MALVKKSKINAEATNPAAQPPRPPVAPAKSNPQRALPHAGNQTIAERVAAATEQLAAGLTQSSAATSELGRSMEQIASGAEEAASASQEQSAAIKRIVAELGAARIAAEGTGKRSDAALASMSDTSGQIVAAVRAINRNAERQLASVALIAELERRAREIGTITQAVSRISDQTNLLALNAAIEAARAGGHGRGFAVVADEVRTLAEISDKSAQEVQQLATAIQAGVDEVVTAMRASAEAATREATAASAVVETLEARRVDMSRIAEDSRAILDTAMEAERAALEAEKGAEQVASAAEEQSSGAGEAQTTVQEQARSLSQAQSAAQTLAALAEDLRRGKGGAAGAEQISSAAEELSATIQEMSSAANEISSAIEEINRACQLQASATHETSAALAQIEKSARLAQENGKTAHERIQLIAAALKTGQAAVETLMKGVTSALQQTQSSVATVGRLTGLGRRIEKIVDAIASVTLQTSMLAVSGSVEAARSGDSGRGFAVVSNDIRSLAREAAENVERAKDTVRGILDQLASLQRDLDLIITSSELQVESNREAAAALGRIGIDIQALAAASQVIVDGSQAILAAAVETATGARQIATAAEEASTASREAATAAAEQSQGAEELAAAIEEIGSLADELRHQNA
jgi:methyl-accepting chemotaxis protein